MKLYLILIFLSLYIRTMEIEKKERDGVNYHVLTKCHKALINKNIVLDNYVNAKKDISEESKNIISIYGGRKKKHCNGVAKENYFKLRGAEEESIYCYLFTEDRRHKKEQELQIAYNKWFKLYLKLDQKHQPIPIEDCLAAYYILNKLILYQYTSKDIVHLMNAIKNGGLASYKIDGKTPRMIKHARRIVPVLEYVKNNRSEIENDKKHSEARWDMTPIKKKYQIVLDFIDGNKRDIDFFYSLNFIYKDQLAQELTVGVKPVINKAKKKKRRRADFSVIYLDDTPAEIYKAETQKFIASAKEFLHKARMDKKRDEHIWRICCRSVAVMVLGVPLVVAGTIFWQKFVHDTMN